MRIEFPEKLRGLFDNSYDNYVLYGGRDGTKSWGLARWLLELGTQGPERILCGRETQQSIKESVHQLLEDQIRQMGLGHCYVVQHDTILGPDFGKGGAINRTEFFFAGLKHNISQIKSFERITRFWVEEADNVSKNSWGIVLPTIRTEGSKLYVTFNPKLSTDETYRRWVLNPPPKTWVQKVGYEDNRWLSERSRTMIEHLRETDPVEFAHIYGGECRSSVEGAIFAKEIKEAQESGRIGQVPYNRARPVDTAWDLGYGDLTAIWFLQVYDGWYNFIDYLEGDGNTIADYLVALQQKGYLYGTDWLPHDATDTIIHRKLGGGNRTMSIEQLMRQAGRKVRIAPKLYIHERINAGRTVFPQCRFDEEKCRDGVQALRHYQWGPLKDHGVVDQSRKHEFRKRDPLHDIYSHGADAFTQAAVSIRAPAIEREDRREQSIRPMVLPGPYDPFG